MDISRRAKPLQHSADLFRRRVRRHAHEVPTGRFGRMTIGADRNAKVGDFRDDFIPRRVFRTVEEDVRGLQVQVQLPILMNVVDRT